MPTVVIVDDDPMIRAMLRAAIRRDDRLALVGEATNGRDGIEVIQDLQPNAVILDLEMPGMTGVDALPELRRAAPDAAVVMFSSGNRHEIEAQARERGADDYIEKSVAIDQLMTRILDLVDLRGQEMDLT